jgi:hypothetical protein
MFTSLLLNLVALTIPGSNGQPGITIKGPNSIPHGGTDRLATAISGGINIMIIVAVILCIVSVVWAGIQWAGSAGDKAKVASARARITWSIIGLVVVLFAFLIVNILGSFFNVNLTK